MEERLLGGVRHIDQIFCCLFLLSSVLTRVIYVSTNGNQEISVKLFYSKKSTCLRIAHDCYTCPHPNQSEG